MQLPSYQANSNVSDETLFIRENLISWSEAMGHAIGYCGTLRPELKPTAR